MFDGSEEMLEHWNMAYNASFFAHWHYRPATVGDCRRLTEEPGFHPDNVLLAFAGGEPAGLVRLGLLHYNTSEEVDRLLAALNELE